VDGLYDVYPERLRPILPFQRYAFEVLVTFAKSNVRPPDSDYIPKPERGDLVNHCSIENTAPRLQPEPDP
jgi:hypothetical protein